MVSCPYCSVLLPWQVHQQYASRQVPQQPYQQQSQQVYSNSNAYYNQNQAQETGKRKNSALIGILSVIGTIVIIIIVFFIIGLNSAGSPSNVPKLSLSEIKSAAQNIKYDELMRNNSKYIGKIAYYRGKIVQVVEAGGDSYVLRVDTKSNEYLGYLGDTIWANYQGSRLLENDIVDIWGKVIGLKTYSALLGNQVTIPEIDTYAVQIITKSGDASGATTSSPTDTGKITISYSGVTYNKIGKYNTPKSGNVYLVLNLNIKNQGYDSFSINAFNFSLVANNIEYSPAFVSELDNELPAINLLNGGNTNGKICFEVPIGTSNYNLTYDSYKKYNIEWIKQ